MDLVNDAAPAAANDLPASAPAEPSAPAPTIADTMASVWEKHNPPRENGRFAPKDGAEPVADGQQAEPQAGDKVSTDQPAKAASEPAQPAIEAPHSWSAEMKAKWAALPPDAQTYIAQRERDAHQAITRAGEQVKQFEPIRGVIEQHADLFQRHGIAPADGIGRLLAAERLLESNPRAAIEQIARAYGVDLSGAPPTPESQTIAELRHKLAQIEGTLTSQAREAQQAQQADLARSIEAATKGLAHYDEVRSIMAGLITSGAIQEGPVEQMVKAAYDMAVYAKPELRERIQKDQRAQEEAKAKADAEKRAADARKAASLNVKSNTGSAPAKPLTIRQTMEAVAEKAGLT